MITAVCDRCPCSKRVLWYANSLIKKSWEIAAAVLGVGGSSTADETSEALLDGFKGVDFVLRVADSARLLDCGWYD